MTPVTNPGTHSIESPNHRESGVDEFAAILSGHLGALTVQGAATADPRDVVANHSTGARRKRIDQEVATMRQGEVDQPREKSKPAPTESRTDRNALRADAKNEAAINRSNSADQKSAVRVKQPVEPPPEGLERLRVKQQDLSNRDAGNRAVRSNAGIDTPSLKTQAPDRTAQSTPLQPTANPVAAGAVARGAETTGARPNAAQTVGQILARDIAGSGSRDGQPIIANGSRPSEQSTPRTRSSEQSGKSAHSYAADKSESGDSARRPEFARLMRMVRLNIGERASSATIRMNPPELGRLRIDVQMQKDQLSIRVETDNPESRALIAERADELIESLRAQQINVDRVEVAMRDASVDPGVVAGKSQNESESKTRPPRQGDQSERSKHTEAKPERGQQFAAKSGRLSIRA